MDYWVLLVTRNGQNLITKTLDSILKQTAPAKLICIVDDGSTDETPFILKRFLNKFPKRIHIVTLPDKGFEVRRLPHNFNLAIKEVERLGIGVCSMCCYKPSLLGIKGLWATPSDMG